MVQLTSKLTKDSTFPDTLNEIGCKYQITVLNELVPRNGISVNFLNVVCYFVSVELDKFIIIIWLNLAVLYCDTQKIVNMQQI